VIKALIKYKNGTERVIESKWDADIRLRIYLEGDEISDWSYLVDE